MAIIAATAPHGRARQFQYATRRCAGQRRCEVVRAAVLLAIDGPRHVLPVVALNRRFHGVSIVRLMWFLPIVTDMISISLVWAWLYDRNFGIINYLIGLFGLPAQSWLSDTRWALFSLVLLSAWRWAGYYAIILLAALQGIPQELYEAAIIDGAKPWQKFRRITLPLITPAIFFVVTLSVISSFQVFEQMWVMTQGGPENSTTYLLRPRVPAMARRTDHRRCGRDVRREVMRANGAIITRRGHSVRWQLGTESAACRAYGRINMQWATAARPAPIAHEQATTSSLDAASRAGGGRACRAGEQAGGSGRDVLFG